jgi:ATP-binding cassette subfamily B protein
MDKKEIGYRQAIENNFYAIKMCSQISKSRVVHTGISRILDYFSWLFYSIFFMRVVIRGIETEQSFEKILQFILISTAIICVIIIYGCYVNNYVKPLTGTLIFQGLYQKLYKKSRNVELRCYEDAEFYNKYTMALDGASERLENLVENFFGVIFGIVAAGVAFYSMFSIDHLAILFVVFPMIGNFVFGGIMNRLYTKRYQDDVKNNRKSDYVNRVMYLADYAKEVRLSNVFDLMMHKYKEAVDGNLSVVQKHAKKAIVNSWLQNVLTFAIVFEGIMLYAAYRTMVTKSIGLAELAIMFSIMSTSSWILNATDQKTVIFISHRLSTTRLANYIYMLEEGRIIEEGKHEELLSKGAKYAQMWRAQAGQYLKKA